MAVFVKNNFFGQQDQSLKDSHRLKIYQFSRKICENDVLCLFNFQKKKSKIWKKFWKQACTWIRKMCSFCIFIKTDQKNVSFFEKIFAQNAFTTSFNYVKKFANREMINLETKKKHKQIYSDFGIFKKKCIADQRFFQIFYVFNA